MPELPSRIDMCIHTGCQISQPRGIVPRCRGAGFILWEIMFALTIFCIVGIALTSALHQAIDTSMIVRDEPVHSCDPRDPAGTADLVR